MTAAPAAAAVPAPAPPPAPCNFSLSLTSLTSPSLPLFYSTVHNSPFLKATTTPAAAAAAAAVFPFLWTATACRTSAIVLYFLYVTGYVHSS